MNSTSFDGYTISYIKWPECYIPLHVGLFRCHVNGYLPCYVTFKSSAPPHPTPIRLSADLQQIESKAYLFTHRQAGQAPPHLWSVLLASGRALVIVGHGLLLLTPRQRVKGAQHPRTPPHRPCCPGRRPRPPCSLRPRWVPLKHFVVHSAYVLKFLPYKCETSIALETLSRGKMKHPGRTQGRPQSAWTLERSRPVQGLTWRLVWRTGPCRVRCCRRLSWTSTWYPPCQPLAHLSTHHSPTLLIM